MVYPPVPPASMSVQRQPLVAHAPLSSNPLFQSTSGCEIVDSTLPQHTVASPLAVLQTMSQPAPPTFAQLMAKLRDQHSLDIQQASSPDDPQPQLLTPQNNQEQQLTNLMAMFPPPVKPVNPGMYWPVITFYSHISAEVAKVIKTGAFVDFAKLADLTAIETVKLEESRYLTMGPGSVLITSKSLYCYVDNFHKWLRAWRAFKAIYLQAFPQMLEEMLQYKAMIHDYTVGHSWSDVYLFDISSCQQISSHPEFTWASNRSDLFQQIIQSWCNSQLSS